MQRKVLAMSDRTEGFYRNITLNDVQLASAYYPILIDLAKHKARLTYSGLVEKAKNVYPANAAVQKAIAVSTGRKLEVVRVFTAERELPDLTCLIINKGAGECGSGFTDHFDPVAAREKVFAFDWSAVSTDFDGYIKHAKTAVTPRKRIKLPDAREQMSKYYSSHRAQFPPEIIQKRELILELLMDGFTPAEAFTQASQAAT